MTGIAGQGAVIPWRELLLVLLTAALATFLATGAIRVLAIAVGAVAIPRDRDVHVKPTPRLGGVGIYLGVLAGAALAAQLPALQRGFDNRDIPAVLTAGTLIVIVGIIDDRWGLDALTKLTGQVFAAGIMALMGLSWLALYWPFDGGSTIVLDSLMSGLVTVFVTITMVNAMNFIDGLDGLAAGVGLITALAAFVFAIAILSRVNGNVQAYPPALLAAVLAGACLGFLPHNFQPARIFMGDSGSMFIGLMLAAVSTGMSGRVPMTAYGPQSVMGLLAPFILVGAVMFIPVLDMGLAVVRRVRAGKKWWMPDKMHLHHRLLELGHTTRRAVLLIYLWVGVLAFGAVGTYLNIDGRLTVLLFATSLILALLLTAAPYLRVWLKRPQR